MVAHDGFAITIPVRSVDMNYGSVSRPVKSVAGQ